MRKNFLSELTISVFGILLSFFLPQSAWGYAECLAAVRQGLIQTPNQVEALLAKQIEEMNGMLQELKVNDIRFYVEEYSHVSSSAYFGSKNRIEIGGQSTKPYEESTGPIAAHEFGHAIFEKHFVVVYDGRRMSPREVRAKLEFETQWFRARLEANPEYKKAQKEADEVLNQRKQAYETGESHREKSLKAKHGQLLREIQERFKTDFPIKTNSEWNRQRELFIPYNELFADLFSALFFNNSSVMANALGFSGKKPFYGVTDGVKGGESPQYRINNLEGPRPRDFSQHTSFKGWQNEPGKLNRYTFFDPARAAIWSMIQKRFSSRVTEEMILKLFLHAASEHLMRRVERGETWNHQRDPETLNREFFSLFVAKAKERKYFRSMEPTHVE